MSGDKTQYLCLSEHTLLPTLSGSLAFIIFSSPNIHCRSCTVDAHSEVCCECNAFNGIHRYDMGRFGPPSCFLQMPIILKGAFPVRQTPRNMNLPLVSPFKCLWPPG
ncbi:hypothetical protein BU25DRAFT_191822 [Macroventuria anomochaeta]|uniref:Uncharacterized protein n=1 Tax=Macroventuria anomochaeta TaxID=301207 RepID=A0ACB6SC60_9PLEO|nr:uncharacterized protein BU25DRAFT_191822 [Macroventuria anomochaeta]KAF2631593.1 hypothetical protein BU25DRAFT_191822 [Macroventuria anomochaeta]